MDFGDPSIYISIISSVLLIISEILPFLPCHANGLFDSVFKISPCCIKAKEEKENAEKAAKSAEKKAKAEQEKLEKATKEAQKKAEKEAKKGKKVVSDKKKDDSED